MRWILARLCLDHVPVGAQDWPANANKPGCVMGHFYDSFGRLETHQAECEDAAQLLTHVCDDNTTLLTGAPLHNLGAAIARGPFTLGRWVAQGGFAGIGVVPDGVPTPFPGKRLMNTWNFQGNCPAAERALVCEAIGRIDCVSKNVCHRTYYDSR